MIFIDRGPLCFYFEVELQAAVLATGLLLFPSLPCTFKLPHTLEVLSHHFMFISFFPLVFLLGCSLKPPLTLAWKTTCFPVND